MISPLPFAARFASNIDAKALTYANGQGMYDNMKVGD
jgi:hypothetical protein